MRYFVFRKSVGYSHNMFWEIDTQFENMTKEELEKNYAALDDCIIIEGVLRHLVSKKVKLI